MSGIDALWQRALRAADARGLVPKSKTLTPAEVAVEAAERGDDRLMRLVNGWYYPRSYGNVEGTLSDDEIRRLVAVLEEEAAIFKEEAKSPLPSPAPAEVPRARVPVRCDLCGAVVP